VEGPILRRVSREVGVPDLLERLAAGVSQSDLQSLLLELTRLRAARRPLPDVAAQYQRDRTVRPGRADPRTLGRLVVAAFDAAAGYEGLDLAPVEPLGANSVLAGIDQNNVLASVRGTEVVADPTIALALEAAWRRRRGIDVVRLCAAHRVLRQQAFEPPALQHFTLFALVTGARTGPDHRSEVEGLEEHVRAHLSLVAAARALGADIGRTVVSLSDTAVHATVTLDGASITADVPTPRDAIPADVARRLGRRLRRLELAAEALAPVVATFDSRVLIDLTRTDGVSYYNGLQLRIDATANGESLEVADGGSVNWASRLLSDRREHLFTSGIGLERLLP
jgi:hypothetical protein